MKLPSFLSDSKLHPKWNFPAINTLWRIIFSTDGFIFGEDRDTENKSVTFFCVQAATGKALWKEKQFAEQWWIGLEGISGGKLFLHGFQKPDMPEHKIIICVDAKTGTELWRNTDCTLYSAAPPFVYGYRDLFERRIYYKLKETDGTFVEELREAPEGNETLQKIDFIFPSPLGIESSAAPIINQHIQDQNLVRRIEYAETGEYLVFNIHAAVDSTKENQNSLSNTLYIVNTQTEKLIFTDLLNAETPYPAPDSFFIDENTLFYIKERKVLTAIAIPS
jgi:hypothetical protein